MNEKLKNFLIQNHGLKADATDAEATAWMTEKNIVVMDVSEPVKPLVPVAQDDSAIKNQIKAVEDGINARLTDIEQGQATMNLQMKDNVEDDPCLGYKDNTSYFLDIIEAGKTGRPSEKLAKAHQIILKNTVGSDEAKVSNDPDGGFLIPKGLFPEVLSTNPQALQNDTGMMTRNIPMSTDVVNINARVDKNHSSSVTGGFQVYRRAEASTVTATKGQFEQIELKVDALMGLSYASDEILDRSPASFAALIGSGFENERISKLNNERLRGTGVGEYMGILNSPALVTVAKESAQTAATIESENVLKMRQQIWGYGNAVWMANPDTYIQLAKMHITGTNGDVFLFNPARGIDIPDTLLGRPVMFDENMGTLGTKGDLALVNWQEYLEGQLGGSSFAESVHVRFIYNETAFKFNVYNAGAPWWRTALTPKQSTQTLSPFVTLAARA